ncbi:MAG: hypothetical protein WDO13_21490 [Verrucomicrobiota bacterium]
MHRVAHEEYPFPGLFTVADIDVAKKGGLDFYYHGGDPVVNSFTPRVRRRRRGPTISSRTTPARA